MTPAPRAIRIAILAMGGEGGGVLADWISDLGEANGHVAQATSVPGVAQRTGATIYYVELFPKAAIEAAGRPPVLALMPVPGDVDIVIASELMEAARAVQRGFVTPDRTLLIASTHRVYAMTERIARDDARSDESAMLDACRKAARRLIGFDMAEMATRTGSVVSAVMFGALAGSKALPFAREAFEATVRRGGVGVAASLEAFGQGFAAAEGGATRPADAPRPEAAGPDLPADLLAEADALSQGPARDIVRLGVARLIDYQDAEYARLYLDRLRPIAEAERRFGENSDRLLAETARHLALGMAYEDTIRVAELKIRAARFERVRREVGAREPQVLEIAEFMHPRLQEIAESVPAGLGRFLIGNAAARGVIERLTRRGRIVKTSTISGFLLLAAVAALKPWRRRSLRHEAEQVELEEWLARIPQVAARDYELAVEVAECRNLVKGYGDTLARGRAQFEALMAALPLLVGPDAAGRLKALRAAALADETGVAFAERVEALGSRPDR